MTTHPTGPRTEATVTRIGLALVSPPSPTETLRRETLHAGLTALAYAAANLPDYHVEALVDAVLHETPEPSRWVAWTEFRDAIERKWGLEDKTIHPEQLIDEALVVDVDQVRDELIRVANAEMADAVELAMRGRA